MVLVGGLLAAVVALGVGGEWPALCFKRIVAPAVVPDLFHAVDRSKPHRHGAIDDAQHRRKIVRERGAEPRRLGRGRRRRPCGKIGRARRGVAPAGGEDEDEKDEALSHWSSPATDGHIYPTIHFKLQ